MVKNLNTALAVNKAQIENQPDATVLVEPN